MYKPRLLLGLLVLSIFSSAMYADEALLKQKSVQAFIDTMVKEYHFKRDAVTATLEKATFQPKIIESMTKPYEKKSWDIYKNIFLTPKRLHAGINFWKANQKTLLRAQKEYNVPADIIVAIIGVETMYGENMGHYRVLDALTTLAFHYPKRAAFFTKELREYLILCKELQVSPDKYLGSYAGAMGKPQFMPSSYRFYAVDFTGNGKRDLIKEDQDVIGSVANYFHQHGWTPKQSVAQPAEISGTRYKKLSINTRNADYSFKQLLASGIKPLTGVVNHPPRAGLIELNTDKGLEFWLAYPNFYVITRYNTSPQYALVVYLLSQQLRAEWDKLKMDTPHAYA